MEESVRDSLRESLTLQDQMVADMMIYIQEMRAEDGGSPSVWIRQAANVAAQLRSIVDGTNAQTEMAEFKERLVAEFKRINPDYDPDDV